MSMGLYWRPEKNSTGELPDELKRILQKRYGNPLLGYHLDDCDLSYLIGLRDAGVKGAQELINAIEKHGRIQIYTQ